MPDFSLYEFARLGASRRDSLLRTLGDVPSPEPSAGAAAAFRTRVDGMLRWCRMTENLVIHKDLRDAELHAGFQRFSRIEPALVRYRKLAAIGAKLSLYGEPDVKPMVGRARLVPVTRGPLRDEWFVVVRADAYSALIVARDLDGFESGIPLRQRRFEGFVTHDDALTQEALIALRSRY